VRISAAPLLLVLVGCGDDAPATVCTGDVLFGRPNAATGLTDEQCAPTCSCTGQPWTAPAYGPAHVAALRSWELLDPPALLDDDPYAAPAPDVDPDEVCGMVPEPDGTRRYRLRTYVDARAAEADGAMVTHTGPCGLCSPLTDLAVYMEQPDLTEPVRQCGLDHDGDPPEEHIACLQAIGFDEPCAQIWHFNTLHTRERCLAPCFLALGQPYHLPDGSLNECLQCDEVQSGPVFKAIAGRTRRNTGLANALCRPCEEVEPVLHPYAEP
jgi:hypothetical protein